MKNLDVAHVNPFLQSSLKVIEMTTQIKASVGRPSIAKLDFPGSSFILRVGVTGVLKGQVLLVMSEDSAKSFASKMMMGMPVETLDEMASSALCELSNMIMGNTATLFAAQNIAMDITPPISLHGEDLKLQTSAQALRVPLLADGAELFSIYLCITEE
jgi:chemotaxis protein CheX